MENAIFQQLTPLRKGDRYTIYRAFEPDAGKIRMLKVPTMDDTFALRNEAGIGHNLPGHYELVQTEQWPGVPVLARDFIEGVTLREYMNGQPLSPGDFLTPAILMAEDLLRIHRQNILHRDLNPDNLIVSAGGTAAHWIDLEFAAKSASLELSFGAIRQLEGSLPYMAPEQTGRMNRKTDYRSDYYALGAIYYEMLCGVTPFDTVDILALIHSHLAIVPVAPAMLRPELPAVLSKIVLKLLAKNAEDRYQSLPGLIADLRRCAEEWEKNGRIDDFELGQSDDQGLLNISQKLYGREKALETLEEAYRRAAQGEKILALVAGFSGVGKSTLAQELFRPVTTDGGIYLAGKFDLIQRGTPYFAWAQAFEQLADWLLTEPEAQLAVWRPTLLEALNGLGRVLTDLAPRFVHILGEQPELGELPAKENQQRISFAINAFINALAAGNRPFVFFLDDWQWADDASLQLLESLFVNETQSKALIIAAYRNNETGPQHPFTLSIQAIRRQINAQNVAQAPIVDLELFPLSELDIAALLSDTLHSPAARVRSLAGIVFDKTHGNAFAVVSLLRSLSDEQLLYFDAPARAWRWEEAAIRNKNISADVADWLTARIQRLPAETVRILQVAAAAGATFRLGHAALICGQRPAAAHRHLEKAMRDSLIAPVESHYKFLPEYYEEQGLDVLFRFAHDRIQQAVYQMIEPENRQFFHFNTGHLLLPLLEGARADNEILFDVAQHFANGAALIAGSGLEEKAGRLLLEAGEKAHQSAAFDVAFKFLQKAQPFATFSAGEHAKLIESAYMSGQETGSYLARALQSCQSAVEQAHLQEVNIRCLVNATRLKEATIAARHALKPLGVSIPEKTPQWRVIAGAVRTGMILPASKINKIIDLPLMTDPEKRAAMRLLAASGPSFHLTDPNTYALTIFEMVRLSMQYGVCAESIQGFSSYGLVLAALAGKPDDGYKIGKQSLLLIDKLEAGYMEPVARFVDGAFLSFIKEPLDATVDTLQKGYQVALREGNLDYASWCIFMQHFARLFRGEYMPALLRECAASLRLSRQYRQLNQTEKQLIIYESIRRITEYDENPEVWESEHFDETEMLKSPNDYTSIATLHAEKGFLLCLYEAWDASWQSFERATPYLKTVFGTLAIHYISIYQSLTAICSGRYSADRKAQKIVQKNLKTLHTLEKRNPGLVRFGILWIEAELAAQRKAPDTRSRYEQALRSAVADGFPLPAACIRRRLGAWLQQTESADANSVLVSAAEAFRALGAEALVEVIVRKYQPQAAPATNTGQAGDNLNKLDTITLIKTAQALGSELKLEKLSEKLMLYALENAGAQRGLLVLRREGRWTVELALNAGEHCEFLQVPLKGCGLLAETVVNYTAKTAKPVVLDNASVQMPFSEDEFVQEHHCCSVLCIPFVHQSQVAGLMYLSNDLTTGAFTADRVSLLTLMAGQMGVSIENALLYEQMERLVAKRTEQLEAEKQKSDNLLLNILPGEIAEELKTSGRASARYYERVSVLFADIKNFTSMAEQLHAETLVQELDHYFRAFDDITACYRIEKIKTIGDAYFCAAGLPQVYDEHGLELVQAALDMQRWVAQEAETRSREGRPRFEVRIGIHSGPVVAGVVGHRKFAYDIWGDTVNVAARLEQNGEPGRINISEATYLLIKDAFQCVYRGELKVKNKAAMKMYFVEA